MTRADLEKILGDHKIWLADPQKGKRANLRYANLNYANLRSANLNSADLSYANLRSANLSYTDLRSANLNSADLSYANLRSANLSYANLRSANLNSADLNYANLRSANLNSADLNYANLNSADLNYANLHGSKMKVDISTGIALVNNQGPFVFMKGKDKIQIGCEVKTKAQWKRITKNQAIDMGLPEKWHATYKKLLDMPLVKWW